MESIRPRAGEHVSEIWPMLVSLQGRPAIWHGEVNLGNGTAFTIFMAWTDRDVDDRVLFVGVEGHGAYSFSHFVHWTYAAEKLGLLQGDAANIADLINHQLGKGRDSPAQGEYDPDLVLPKE